MGLPPIEDLAERVRFGETISALATEYGVARVTLQGHFYRAGFTSAGEPRPKATNRPPVLDATGLGRVVRSWLEPWMEYASCAYVSPEDWFPEKGGNNKAARAICAVCPVVEECREYALANHERYGIWGNTSERERRKLLKGAA